MPYTEFNYIIDTDKVTDAYTGEVIEIKKIPEVDWLKDSPFQTTYVDGQNVTIEPKDDK